MGTAAPATAQALTPYVLPLDYDLLTEQGLFLASEAQQLAEFRQFNRALALAQLAVQLAPDSGQVVALLGGLYLQTGEVERAIPLLSKAERLLPDEPRVLFSLGSAYLQQQEYQQASTYLERGLALEPDNANALFDLGNAYFLLDRYNDAIASYEKSVATEPEFWPSVNNIGLVLYEQGEAQQAIEHWRDSLDLAPQEPEPKLAIAVAQYNQANCTVPAIRTTQAACREAIAMGIEALEQDSRYSEVDFLRLNLWGDRLINSTNQFFAGPDIRQLIAEL
jgi:tetratricopeptide (TPR) repeat protein